MTACLGIEACPEASDYHKCLASVIVDVLEACDAIEAMTCEVDVWMTISSPDFEYSSEEWTSDE